MTNDAQVQRILHGWRPVRKNSARGMALGTALLAVFLSASAWAAVFTVDSPADPPAGDATPGDGVCHTVAAVPICTLRAAIEEANALAGADTIILPPNTYLLTQLSELTITDHLTITGGGAATTIIDGNGTLRSDPGFLVTVVPDGMGAPEPTVNISGVTIRNGRSRSGGGIFNGGTLTLTNSVVSGNNGDFGGGIYNSVALTLTDSVVSGNNAQNGGGVFNGGGTLTLTDSVVSGNSAGIIGGGIHNSGGTLTLTNSVVSGNSANGHGGGIVNVESGTLTLTNSTVNGNNANGNGGGIFNTAIANLFNGTITDNRADADLNGRGIGGGVARIEGTVNFQNTIIAGNFETVFSLPAGRRIAVPGDCSGTLTSHGNNLLRRVNCTVNGTPPLEADPLLGPVQNNGGPTQTHAPLAGSPAIDAGSPTGCRDHFGVLLTTDQRGFRRTVDGSRDGTARCDIGAVEFGSGAGVTFNFDVDFDGDGRSDIGVYRDGTWFVLRSFDGGVTATGWGGLAQDLPVPGDYDGDGKTDVAVYRDGAQSPTQALWFIRRSSDGGMSVFQWGGLLQDVPVPGDYDGDGRTDVAVYRDGTWFIAKSFDGAVTATGWGGLPQDIPVPADYDGDRRTDIAVYRDGSWFIVLSNGGMLGTGWGGLPQDVPVPGDHDGDGKADLAVYRHGSWFVLQSSDGGVRATGWGGLIQDVAVPGDYDGDGKTDVGIYRDGSWHIVRSGDGGVTSVDWGGLPQDIPLSRRND